MHIFSQQFKKNPQTHQEYFKMALTVDVKKNPTLPEMA